MNGASVAPDESGWTADAIARVAGISRTQFTAGGRRHDAALRTARAAVAIDTQLFRPGSWLMLDAGNAVVPGVRPGTLHQAIELVGQGSIRSFFGRLRPGVAVVDIDMVRSSAALMAVVGWAAERGLWHLVRASGRRGHHHVYLVVGDQLGALNDFVAQLRVAEGVSRSRIDVRDAVRPLCAPHRCEPTPQLPRLGAMARQLPKALAGLPGVPDGRSVGRRPAPIRSGSSGRAASAIQRRRAGLPPGWREYLAQGVIPPHVRNWADSSRSAVESTATYQMVMAGWSADQAWLVITTCHRSAMSKARGRGRGWWVAHVWNPAVASAAAPGEPGEAPVLPSPASTQWGGQADCEAEPLAQQVARLRGAFLASWQRYGRDRRHTLRFVLETLTDRMLRSGSPTVPCPERDLVVDTGINSRRLLREALRELDARGWLVLQRTFVPGGPGPGQRSHHVSLPAVLPCPPPSGLHAPPRSFTPLPLAVRASLGPLLWHTWSALSPRPAAMPALAGSSGAGASPTGSQLAVLRARLTKLATLGLAEVDANGRWRSLGIKGLDPRFAEQADRAREQRLAQVGQERAHYDLVRSGAVRRAQLRQAAATSAAAARQITADSWWRGLPESERRVRQERYQARFAALGVPDQLRIKHQLATRRAAAGVVSEEAVRQAWVQSMPAAEYTSRVIARTMEYRSLPAPLRAAKAASWAAHRATWGISRDWAAPVAVQRMHPDASPRSALGRSLALEQLELMSLADLMDRDPDGRLSGLIPARADPASGGRAG